jgi:hypothetical protein
MLSIARKGWRRKVGFVVAAFYLLALATPVAAASLSVDLSRAHCLDEIHALASDHHAADHADHHQSPAADPSRDAGQNCCGLFGVTAIAPSFWIAAVPMAIASSVAMTPSASLFGRGFDRIDRPPRSLLPL